MQHLLNKCLSGRANGLTVAPAVAADTLALAPVLSQHPSLHCMDSLASVHTCQVQPHLQATGAAAAGAARAKVDIRVQLHPHGHCMPAKLLLCGLS